MENGFKTLPGVFVVYGLMGMPLWLYANKYVCTGCTATVQQERHRYKPHSLFASPWLGLPALMGRLLGMVVELYVVARHVDSMLGSEKGLPHTAPPGAED